MLRQRRFHRNVRPFFVYFYFMSKAYSKQLTFILTLFVCLLLMLCYFNRLATDDYYFIWDVRHNGIIGNVKSQYMEWCGRFAATFAMDVFYKFFDIQYSDYMLFPLLSAILLSTGMYFLLGNVSSKVSIKLTKSQKVLASSSFTALLFFLSVDIGESWFWFCGLSSYLWSIIAFVWGCVFLSNTKHAFLSTLFAVLCFIYIGGSSEVYSVIYGLFFTTFLYINYRNAENIKLFISTNKKFLVVYFVFAISFIIFLIAPGNYLRDGLFPEHQFWYSFFITAKSFVKFGILYLPSKLPYILVFAVPFLFLENVFKLIDIKLFHLSFKTFFIKSTILFIGVLFVFFLMVAYVMVETGPPRMWFLVSFMLSIYCCFICFYAGYKDIFKEKQLSFVKNGSVALGIGLMLFHFIYQYPIASNYAKATDSRNEYVIELNKTIKNDTLIYLEPLPAPGMLYSTEISTDTTHFTNRELRLGYELKFHVALRK